MHQPVVKDTSDHLGFSIRCDYGVGICGPVLGSVVATRSILPLLVRRKSDHLGHPPSIASLQCTL